MEKILLLKTYVDGGINDTPFPNAEEQIELVAFRYEAKRMGGAPTITATLNYPTCLDEVWNNYVYATLNGERYFLKQTPTSTKSNEYAGYKHELELVSERIILDNTYFYDAVSDTQLENDKPITNNTKFNFFGNIEEFVKRMNSSLRFTGLQKVTKNSNGKETISGYRVIIDNDIVKGEDKLVSFESAVFSQALQESYNTFGIPFYFIGKEIHIGYSDNVLTSPLEYGHEEALLSIVKNNANFKVVNRATGSGSSDNIPYYYPNNSPKGDVAAKASSSKFSVEIKDYEKYTSKVKIGGVVEKRSASYNGLTKDYLDVYQTSNIGYGTAHGGFKFIFNATETGTFTFSLIPEIKGYIDSNGNIVSGKRYETKIIIDSVSRQRSNSVIWDSLGITRSGSSLKDVNLKIDKVGKYRVSGKIEIRPLENIPSRQINWRINSSFGPTIGWVYNDESVELKDLGLEISGTTDVGSTITQVMNKFILTSDTLQPSIYRATEGKERFYNAKNYPFKKESNYILQYGEYVSNGYVHNDVYKDDNGNYYTFENEYSEVVPKEHVFTIEDIKPTIKDMSVNGLRIDMFSEFAYNKGDNDETYMDEKGEVHFKHPYFFGKLRKMGFNLFEHASENGAMTISMTSGNCGACNFEIGVDDEGQFNPVQVDEKGNLIYDENGYVLCGLEDVQGEVQAQDRQQDTKNYEVWIALKKEEETYGILMPKAPIYEGDTVVQAGHRPKPCSSSTSNDGDTFVVLNITLPDEYIYKAEKDVEKAIIKYIWENNKEKFNFSINFSRIFLEENEKILKQLNENARLVLRYNNKEYLLYVSSFSYSMNDGDVLPEIRIEVDDTLTISQNALQNAINEVRSDIVNSINAIDVVALGAKYFIRKDVDDVATGVIDFTKGVYFGKGGNVKMYPDGSGKLTIDYLEVRRKATFTSLEIQERTHVGGQILLSPAAMTCSNVEEIYDSSGNHISWRCYFQSKGEGIEEVFNTFAVDDQAICQTFNEWGSKYYWRLVVGIGEDYIDLSVEDCAPESDAPSIGDKIIQLGNRKDTSRQAAQVLSAYGDDAPSFIMYNGINSFSLTDKEVTGILWNPAKQEPQMFSYGDFFFGDKTTDQLGNPTGQYITYQKKKGDKEKKLHINADIELGSNSSGLSNLSEWKTQDQRISDTEVAASSASQSATLAQSMANRAEEDAKAAKSMAENAQIVAANASKQMEEWTEDGVISPLEKQGLKNEVAFILGDYNEIYRNYETYFEGGASLLDSEGNTLSDSNGKKLAVEIYFTAWSDYKSAYEAYKKDLEYKINTEGTVSIGDMSSLQETFYNKRTIMLNAVSDVVKEEADESKNMAQSALDAIENFEVDTSDFDYLKAAFNDAKSMTIEGVVMSQMMAVADVKDGASVKDSDVKAFLNGSSFGEDDTHGKMMMAGGIPKVSGSKSTKLEDRAKEATTRMYEDGALYANKGFFQGVKTNSLKRNVAMIDGVVHFESQIPWYMKDFEETNGTPNSPDDIVLGNRNQTLTRNNTPTPGDGYSLGWQTLPDLTWDITQIGRTRTFINHYHEVGYSNAHANLYTPDNTEKKEILNCDGLNPPYFYVNGMPCKSLHICPNDCISLYGYGYFTNKERTKGKFMGWIVTSRVSLYGNYSHMIEHGMTAGLRPRVKYITDDDYISSSKLNEYDYTIIVECSKGVTLTLPSSPKPGQRYEIMCANTNSVNINGNGKKIYSIVDGKEYSSDPYSAGKRRHITLTYNGNNGKWYEIYNQYS